MCECSTGYTGVDCITNIDNCDPNPCENNGTCTDLVDDFFCRCLPGYAGEVCAININDCDPNPCKNNGTCTDLIDQYPEAQPRVGLVGPRSNQKLAVPYQ